VKGLPGLIRLHQWKLDEARRQLVALESLADDFRRQIIGLDEELRREAEIARGSEDAARLYGSYLTASRTRRQRLDNSLAEVVRQISEAHGLVTRAFQELKRYELALQAREKKQAEQARRVEQHQTDEVGLNLYRRRG